MLDVLAERARQDAKWGVQNHVLTDWVPILGEEFGEFCQAVLEGDTFNNGRRDEFTVDAIRAEAVQVAAVALAIVECIDRAAARDAVTTALGAHAPRETEEGR